MTASHFRTLAQGVDIRKVNAELDAHPELWGQNGYRTVAEDSPHHGVPDIWLRWRAAGELTTPLAFAEPHFSAFWPAWHMLPSLHPIIYNLAAVVRATMIGGILITKIEPGKSVAPHTDNGWHAKFYDTKLYLVLKANPLCLNWVEDEPLNPREGDVFEFSNQKVHSVENAGRTDRVTVIACFKTEGRTGA